MTDILMFSRNTSKPRSFLNRQLTSITANEIVRFGISLFKSKVSEYSTTEYEKGLT